jgi:hypothetical protein
VAGKVGSFYTYGASLLALLFFCFALDLLLFYWLLISSLHTMSLVEMSTPLSLKACVLFVFLFLLFEFFFLYEPFNERISFVGTWWWCSKLQQQLLLQRIVAAHLSNQVVRILRTCF